MGFCTKFKFDPDRDIPSLEGKVILVTGVNNTGLGRRTAVELAKHSPARIWVTARTAQKVDDAIVEIQKDLDKELPAGTPRPQISGLELELASFKSVRAAARRLLAECPRLDLLILNAGVNMARQEFTEDGYEKMFGVNYMGNALFAKLVLPILLRTAGEKDEKGEGRPRDVRLILVGSDAHRTTYSSGVDLDLVKREDPKFFSQWSYGRSKLAATLWAQEMAARYPSVRIVPVHPGWVQTDLVHTTTEGRAILSLIAAVLWPLVAMPVREGVKNQLWAATDPDVRAGVYYEPVGLTGKDGAWLKDKDLQKKIWDWTEEELKDQTV